MTGEVPEREKWEFGDYCRGGDTLEPPSRSIKQSGASRTAAIMPSVTRQEIENVRESD